MTTEPITYATLPEVMIYQIARTIEDGGLVFHGFGSPVPTLAMLLAKRSHAPRMVHVEGATYGVDPEPPFLPPTSNDWVLEQGSIFSLDIGTLFDMAARGDMARMFLSGVQIDGYGNMNITAIGSADKPKVKLPGGGGGCNLSGDVQHITIWTAGHRAAVDKAGRKRYRFVRQVDFVSSIGHFTPDGRSRESLGLRGGGADWVVTELGVFDFEPETRLMRLRALYPDTTVEHILENTEFEPVIPANIATVPLPSPDQVALIRRFDPLCTHHREFRSGDLARHYNLSSAQHENQDLFTFN